MTWDPLFNQPSGLPPELGGPDPGGSGIANLLSPGNLGGGPARYVPVGPFGLKLRGRPKANLFNRFMWWSAGFIGGFSAAGFLSSAAGAILSTGATLGQKITAIIAIGSIYPTAAAAVPGEIGEVFRGGSQVGSIVNIAFRALTFLSQEVPPFVRDPLGIRKAVNDFGYYGVNWLEKHGIGAAIRSQQFWTSGAGIIY